MRAAHPLSLLGISALILQFDAGLIDSLPPQES